MDKIDVYAYINKIKRNIKLEISVRFTELAAIITYST